jgi:hypothetical protein
MNPTLRCKLRVSQVTQSIAADGKVESESVALIAVYGEAGTENAKWSKWTPSANFNITINNPDAMGKLSKGHEFYVDFTPVA